MNCEMVRDRIDEYVMGELDTVTLTAVAEHLNSCPACREHEACAREIADALPDMKIHGPTALRHRIASAAFRPPSRVTPAWRTLALAASILVMLGIYWSWSSRPEPYPGSHPSFSAVPTVDTPPMMIATDTKSADTSYVPSTRIAHKMHTSGVNHSATSDTAMRDESVEDTFLQIPNSSRDPLAGDRSEDAEAASRLERMRQRHGGTGNK